MIKRFSFFSFLSESILIFIIIFAPFFFGSYLIFGRSILQLSSLFLLFIVIVRISIIPKPEIVYPASIFFMLSFFAVALFQLIPLSKETLKLLSPNTLKLYQQYLSAADQRDSFTLSIYHFATKERLAMLFASFCLFFSVINAVDKKSKFERLVVIIILWATGLAFYGIMKRFLIYGAHRIVFGTFGNRNHYAGYMVMMAPLAIGYALSCQDKYKKLIFVFLGAVISASIFISGSRAGTLSVLFALLCLPLLLSGKVSTKNNRWVVPAVFIFLIILLLMGEAEDLHDKFSRVRVLHDLRWTIFGDSLRLMRDFPLFGIGLGNFQYIFTKYTSFFGTFTMHLHNDYFQLLVETGFIAFIFCTLFFIMVFKEILKQLQKTEDPFIRNLVAGGLSGLFGILLHAGFSFHFHIPASLFMFWLILGLMYKCVHSRFIYEEKGT